MSETADFLLTNASILCLDEEFNQYKRGALAVQGEMILAVGDEDNLLTRFNGTEIIDCGGHVLMPGLVNAHTHAAMTLLRGLADDLRLDVWLLGYMMPVEREFVAPDFVRLGSLLGCVESIRSGVTCLADMYYYEEEVAKTIADTGLRAVCSQTVLKFTSPDAPTYEEALDAARDFILRWKGHPLIVPSVAPHSPYTCTEDIIHAATDLAVEFDVPLHTHLAETQSEVDDSHTDHGLPVIPYVESHNLFDAKVLAAHCVHVDGREIHTLHRYGAGVAHCPSSNLKLASGIAPVKQMIEVGVNVGIGTDGAASNNDLDMFEEIRLAAFLAKGITKDPTIIPAKTALAMATRLGANALHLGEITGSLEVGKRADLILVNIDNLHNSPHFHRDPDGIYAQIVYSAKSTDVTDVMVNGKWLMRDRQIKTIDETSLLAEAQDYAREIDTFLIAREQSVLSKLVAIGGALEQESYEVQAKVRLVNTDPVFEALKKPDLEILYHRHYHEYDTYFKFDEPDEGQLRYREDEYIGEGGEVTMIRYRLTMIGPTRERRHFPSDILLSRSRYLATATHSLRFYREYFNPSDETFIEKDRLRWRVLFRGTEFYINLDRLDQPPLGTFLEVKSRTWSRLDAENKAHVAQTLLEYLGVGAEQTVTRDYVELIDAPSGD